MSKLKMVMVINPLLCTGCLGCELACSIIKTGTANPAESRIKITKGIEDDICVPVVCRHCDPAPCAEECPVEAIVRDRKTGAVVIDYEVCIGCDQCLTACPFGAIQHSRDGDVIKCDLCGGNPHCVKFCKPRPPNSSSFLSNPKAAAIEFVSHTDVTKTRRMIQKNKFLAFIS